MGRKIIYCICIILVSTALALAEDSAKDPKKASKSNTGQQGAKELDGMSIVGNDEAPKSLYIVPWKSSEIGIETTLNMTLNEKEIPVDREVFSRQLNFYEISTQK